jgi:hypothetical protein
VRTVVEIEERSGSNEGFAATVADAEEEWNVGDLFSEDVDGAVNPDDLLVGVGEHRAGGANVLAAEPRFWSEGALDWWSGGALGAGDVEAEEFQKKS